LDIDEGFIIYLLSLSELQDKISDRLYPSDSTPDSAVFPLVTYSLISGIDDHCMGEDPNYAEDDYQFKSMSESKQESKEIAKIINRAFKDFSGVMGGDNGVQVDAVLQINRRDSSDKISASQTVFSTIEDYIFMYHKE
jgi:hypothetical protein